MESEREPYIPIREDNDRRFVADEILDSEESPMTQRELPWYAIFRIPIGQLITVGTLFLSVAGLYATVNNHSNEIQEIKATSQTKESARAEQTIIIQKLEAMEKQREQDRRDFIDRLDRIEDRLDAPQSDRWKGRR